MASTALESAIAPHLQQERTIPAQMPANYQPPFPAYSARFPTSIKDIVMAVVGAQHRARPSKSALPRVLQFVDQASSSLRPRFAMSASVTDNSGFYNEIVILYWDSRSHYDEWADASGFKAWWDGIQPETEPHGWFQEVFFPPVERFETVFSDNVVSEGAAHMQGDISGQIQEHVYWGSMRDRLPIAQTDHIAGSRWTPNSDDSNIADQPSSSGKKTRTRVSGQQNLAIIRSGQDWSNTTPHERKLYLDTMHPVLIRGMDFLRDSGREVGCFSCRFMDVLNDATLETGTDKTFGLAYFDDLASLEDWSKRHKTHLDIFGRFLQYAKELENNVSLRLFHEVMVLESGQQFFEYVGCHEKTGMLASRS